MRTETVSDATEFARAAADAVCAVAHQRPAAAIGLPSGRTPVVLYEELVRRARAGAIDFSGLTVFAIDELYGIDREHPATNASYFRKHLAGLPLAAVHVLDGEARDAGAECARFRALIEEHGGLDLVVLGIGANGHLAFNEPGSAFDSRARLVNLAEETRRAYADLFDSPAAVPAQGLTLGVADLLDARSALLLARGEEKARAVAAALLGPIDEALPASALQRHPDLHVIVDEAAATGLQRRR